MKTVVSNIYQLSVSVRKDTKTDIVIHSDAATMALHYIEQYATSHPMLSCLCDTATKSHPQEGNELASLPILSEKT